MKALLLACTFAAAACASPAGLVRDARAAHAAVQAPMDKTVPRLVALHKIVATACGDELLLPERVCVALVPALSDLRESVSETAKALDEVDRALSALESFVGP